MQILDLDADFAQVIGEFLRGALGERRHQHAFFGVGALAALVDKIVYLASQRFDGHFGVHQSGGAHDLLSHAAFRPFQLPGSRRGADVNRLVLERLKFLEAQRPVVQRARQAKTVLDQHRLARAVALVHAADLGHRRVRFVNDQQVIFRKEIEQRARARAGRASAEVAGIILNPGAETHFLHHLKVIFGAHLKPLGFEQLAVLLKPTDALAQFLANRQQRRAQLLGGCDELFARINRDGGKRFDLVAGQRLEARDPFDFVAEKLDPQGVFAASGAKLDCIAAHAKLAAGELDVVASVLQVH